jgi:hypothetical protein
MLEEVLQCLLRRILCRYYFNMLLYRVQCMHKWMCVSRIFGVIRGSCIQNILFSSIFLWKCRGLHAKFLIDDILILHTIVYSYISARPNSSQVFFLSAMSSVLRSVFNIFYHAKCRSIARTLFFWLSTYLWRPEWMLRKYKDIYFRYRFPDENYIV